MHEKLLTLLESRMNDWMLYSEFKGKAWPLTTYQAIILNIIIAMIREARQDLYVRCRSMLHAVTTTCITGGLFSYAKMRAQIEPTDSLLFSWTYAEEVKRLALSIYKLNVQFGTGMLKLSDLQFPLPDSGYLWDAQGSKEFYRRRTIHPGESLYGNRMPQPGPDLLGAEFLPTILFADNVEFDFGTFATAFDSCAPPNLDTNDGHRRVVDNATSANYNRASPMQSAEQDHAVIGGHPFILNNSASGQARSLSPQTFLHVPGRFETPHVSSEDEAYLASKGAFELPSKSFHDELVLQYFLNVHPFTPLLIFF
ncbi:hypothetical protein CNMCM8980_006014 [Aspergillus fumigatiaffinis]|nr:hypothetical protein CNMCM6457_004885 [Aspergillus fumigatiaffinis]KAF4229915.1 hypothetical protein CNMCM8980_006014 [Aspergillus fumigatiaffinis]